MTLGEHIQELRKAAGLSQEAMGEKLGVTRQSISKWESDLTMPEVEKLVAMSRLFGVSVGSLLQVEAEGAPVPEELTERELQAVEAIVGKYIHEMEQTRRPARRRWPAVLAVLLAAAVCWNLFSRMGQVDRQLEAVQSGLMRTDDNIARQIGGITRQVEEALERQNDLVADWSWEIHGLGDPEADLLDLTVRVTPKQFVEGMSLSLVAELPSGERCQIAAAADPVTGNSFVAEHFALPAEDGVKLTAVMETGGEKRTQVLDTFYFYSQTHLRIHAWPSGRSRGGPRALEDGAASTVLETDWEMSVKIYPKNEVCPVYPTSAQIIMEKNGVAVETWPVVLDEFSTDELPALVAGSVPIEAKIGMVAGDRLEAVLVVTDNLGRTQRQVLEDLV